MKKTHYIWALLLIAVVAAVAFFYIERLKPNLDPVKDLLMDPYSAKFENIEVLPSGVICGTVNSKNSYGAFTGKQAFAVMGRKGYLATDSIILIDTICVEALECSDMKCVHDQIDHRITEKQREVLTPQIKKVNENLASLCFSRLPNKSNEQMDCLKELTVCRDGYADPNQQLKCIVEAYHRRNKAHKPLP